MDVQLLLDALLAAHPEWHTYVSALFYVPPGAPAPAEATHVIGLGNRRGQGVTIALAVVPPYDVLVDSLIAAINMPPIQLPEASGTAELY